MPAMDNLPPVSSPPTQWKMGKDGLEYPVYEDGEEYPEYEDDELSADDFPPPDDDDDDDHLLDYYPEDYYPEDPYEDHNKRMNPKFVQKVSKAEADKLISKSIANTLTNFKDSNGKKGKGIYFCC